MTTAFWIMKGFIATLFMFTGMSKLILPKARLLAKGMKGLKDLDEQQIMVTGFLEVLGALGLILPTLFNIYPFLSVAAAFCLGLTMIVAGWIHYKQQLSIVPNITVFVLCMLIAFWEVI